MMSVERGSESSERDVWRMFITINTYFGVTNPEPLSSIQTLLQH
jgi:hypothetical protein|eukprot:COSAG06_NODE_3204_length_5688_cov_11.682233_7_plen_44_part_00